jgi:hypothetical protein
MGRKEREGGTDGVRVCVQFAASERQRGRRKERERERRGSTSFALLCLVSVYIHIVKEREETFIFKGKKASEDLKSTPRSLRE